MNTVAAQKRGSYQKYRDADRFHIRVFANKNENSKALICLQCKFPGLKKALKELLKTTPRSTKVCESPETIT